jgi:dihydrolipoamide dehydrogenase
MGNEKVERYDMTIIGGGAGGYTAALEAVRKGFSVALVEKDRIGGTCLNRGCVPTQCLLRDLTEYAFFLGCDYIEKGPEGIRLNLERVIERKNRVVDQLVKGTESTLLDQGVAIFQGEAAFVDPQTVVVEPSKQKIRSKHVIMATGSQWRLEAPLAFDHKHIWDTTDALNMKSVPKSIAILGEGHRAMTFADIFHYLGAEVHVIVQSAHVLPAIDRGITSRYRKVLREKRICLHTDTRANQINPKSKLNGVEMALEGKKGTETLRVAKVLVPGEREANVEGLQLGRIGLSLKNRLIPVDRDLMTPVPGVYAIGDMVGGKYAAHKAMTEGMAVVRHLAGENPKINYDLIPLCLYTNPQVASVGFTEEEAERRGHEIEVGYSSFAAGARPAVFGLSEGIIKVVSEKRYGDMLGVHIIGPQATEIISLASMAMKNELSLAEVKEVVYPHPSFSESLRDAVEDALHMIDQVKGLS